MTLKKTISLFIAACTLFFATNVLRGALRFGGGMGGGSAGQVLQTNQYFSINPDDNSIGLPLLLMSTTNNTRFNLDTESSSQASRVEKIVVYDRPIYIAKIDNGTLSAFTKLDPDSGSPSKSYKLQDIFGSGGSPAAPGYPTPPYPVSPPPPPGAKTPSPPAGPGYSAPPLPPPPGYSSSPAATTYGAPPPPPPPVYSSAWPSPAPSAPEPYRSDREKKRKRASSDDDEESKPSATTVPAHGHFLSMKLKSLDRTFYLTSSNNYPERKSAISQKTNDDGLTVLTVPKTHNTLRSVPVWISPDKTLRRYVEIAPGETIELDEVIELLSNATNGFRDVVREQPSQRPTVRSYSRATEPYPGRTRSTRTVPRPAAPRTKTYRYESRTAEPSTYLGYPPARRSEYYPA